MVPALTVARLAANAVYRYTPPFIATIARGLDVDLTDIGRRPRRHRAVRPGVAARRPARRPASRVASPMAGRDGRHGRRHRGRRGQHRRRRVRRWPADAGASPRSCSTSASIAWIADHVPYERRGRVVGIIETSWALGLLDRRQLARRAHRADVVALGATSPVLPASSSRMAAVRRASGPESDPASTVAVRRPDRAPGARRLAGDRRHVRPDVGGAVAVRHVRARGWRTSSASAAIGLAAVTFGHRGARARRVDHVGGAHRPLGQGAQRRRAARC